MQLPSLPPEVTQMILLRIPPQSRKPVSLVSKAWRSMIFPLLFETVALYSDTAAEGFIQTILDEVLVGDARRLNFRYHVRRVNVASTMDKQQLETFGRALAILQNLEHLYWNVWLLADSGVKWHDTLVLLHQELAKLRSLSLEIAQNEILMVVSLTKIRELDVNFTGMISDELGDYIDLPNTLVELVRGASNVESLSLRFEEDDECGAAPWASLSLFSELSSDYFPNLRKFSIASSRFGPIDEEFQRFIQKHRNLQKIVLNTGAYDPNWWNGVDLPLVNFSTEFVEGLMPSIRHFGGPGCFVGALLESNLSGQLEILELIEPALEAFGSVSQLLQEIGNSIVPELPCLRGLAISVDDDDDSHPGVWENVLGALSRVADRMPVLEELLIATWKQPSSDELEELFQLLDQLPRLRRLVVPTPGRDNMPLSVEFQGLYQRTQVRFPQLHILSVPQRASYLS